MCSLPMCTCTSSSLSMRGLFDVVLVFRAAEIGLAHAFVGGDLPGAAAGEDRALRHYGNVVGDLENDFDVVLNDDDVDRAGKLTDFADDALGFRRTHAAGRLVKQQ